MKVSDNKERIQKIKAIAEWVLIGLALCIVVFTLISVTLFDKNDRSLFGFRAYVCMSDSMKATDFASGDLVVVKKVDPNTLQVGDIISYVSENSDSMGKTITHKIRNIKKTGVEPAFIVYGTTTGINDENPVTCAQITGKYLFHIPGLGNFFMFLKTVPGYLLCVFLPLVLLFAVRLGRSIKLQKEYMKARVREEIEEEKKENDKGGQENENKEKIID